MHLLAVCFASLCVFGVCSFVGLSNAGIRSFVKHLEAFASMWKHLAAFGSILNDLKAF